MQAITTKTLPPANVKGIRVKATAAAGSVTIGWDHALDKDGNHRRAAEALAHKLEWDYALVSATDVKGLGQHIPLHANMAESVEGKRRKGTKYRPGQIERPLVAAQMSGQNATLKIHGQSGPDSDTKHLSLTASELAALLDLFNQIDKD